MVFRVAMCAAVYTGMEMIHIASCHPLGGIRGVILVFLQIGIAANGAFALGRAGGNAALMGLCKENLIAAGAVFVMLPTVP